MSNLPDDLKALLLRVGDQIKEADYGAIPIDVAGEDVPLFDELVSRGLLTYRNTTGTLGSSHTFYNATKFTYNGKNAYEEISQVRDGER